MHRTLCNFKRMKKLGQNKLSRVWNKKLNDKSDQLWIQCELHVHNASV